MRVRKCGIEAVESHKLRGAANTTIIKVVQRKRSRIERKEAKWMEVS